MSSEGMDARADDRGTRTERYATCLHQLIETQVARTPNAPAVRFEDRELSYAVLDARANRLARYLRELGVGPDEVVAIMLTRSIDMIVALLAVMKAGGAYLPLDPEYPLERQLFLLSDAGVSVVLTREKWASALTAFEGTCFSFEHEEAVLAHASSLPLEVITGPADLAYVIYTSGSTGQPKGCMIPHAAICNRLLWMQDRYALSARDRVLQKTPYTFDVSVWEFFWPLLSGACLVFAKPDGHKDARYLVDLIRTERITVCHFVPSMLRFFLRDSRVAQCDSLRHVFASGEELPFDSVRLFASLLPAAELHNLYGPTEAAVDVTFWKCEERADRKVPIGRPIDNVDIRLLTATGEPTPPGEEGDLYICGVGVGRGYLNRPELTAERFVDDPLGPAGAKMYKSGDRARLLPDGEIEFLGRADFQVKLRGLRIELGEIEAALRLVPGVADVVVVVRDEHSEDPRLVAYVAAPPHTFDVPAIRQFLSSKLPKYMVPNVIARLDAMPVTTHGKLDRARLPWPTTSTPASLAPSHQGPAAVQLIEHISTWIAAALHVAAVPKDGNLFDLGATSLTLVQLVESIAARFNVTIPVDVILDEPTIDAIVRHVERHAPPVSSAVTATDATLHADVTTEILRLTCDALRVTRIDTADNLFDLGATSLTLVQIVDSIARRFAVAVPVEAILDSPTVAAMVSYVVRTVHATASAVASASTTPAAAKTAIPLRTVRFDASLSSQSAPTRTFQEAALPLSALAHLLGMFAAKQIDERRRFLYPSSGDLTAVQAYVWVKRDRVAGLAEGVYYYHPVNHALARVASGTIALDAFVSEDRAAIESSAFVVCLVGEMAAIEPIYREASYILLEVEAGYMSQLLLNRQHECGVGITPLSHTNSRSIASACGLAASQYVICALAGGLADINAAAVSMGPAHAVVEELLASDGTHARPPLVVKDALSKPLIEATKQEQRQLQPSTTSDRTVTLTRSPVDTADFTLRSSRREYDQAAIDFRELSKLLSLLRAGDPASTLYATVRGIEPPTILLHVKPARIEGLEAGLYRYDAKRHELQKLHDLDAEMLEACYTPFNRRHYKLAAFCLFVTQDATQTPLPADLAEALGWRQAGHIGQVLMERQAEMNLGLCPIGGLRADRWRELCGFGAQTQLLHTFFGGRYEQAIPAGRALLEPLPEQRAPARNRPPAASEALAIVGLSGRYPGARTLTEFWQTLRDGVDAFSPWPASRTSDASSVPRDLAALQGGFLADIESFDSLLFNISPFEARALDPQERLLLELTWECLEDAGYTASTLQRPERVGVFVGAMWNDYQAYGVEHAAQGRTIEAMAIASSLANRLSHYFDFSGPSVTFNTSCASFTTALHFACESVKARHCDAALVGGVNLVTHSHHLRLLAQLGLLSPDYTARPFAADSNGWVVGEGVGSLLIKRHADAVRDRDHIYGLIKGTLIAHSGRTFQFGAPSADSRVRALREVLERAAVRPDSISYVETAVAGTGIADAAEVSALKTVLAPRAGTRCHLGSVKANIGHLESASALSQITKVVLQFQHGMLAPTRACKPASALMSLEGSGLAVVEEVTPWSTLAPNGAHQPLRALVNAYGATGAAGHIVLEQAFDSAALPSAPSRRVVILLSAASAQQLDEGALRLAAFLRLPSAARLDVADIAFTLRVGRVAMRERLACVVDSIGQLIEKLSDHVAGRASKEAYRGTVVAEPVAVAGVRADDAHQLAACWAKGELASWEERDDANRRRVSLPTYPFARVAHWVRATERQDTEARSQSITFMDASAAASDKREVERYLTALFASVAEIPCSQVDPAAALELYGINSTMIQRLNQRLEAEVGALSKTLFFEHRSIRALANYLYAQHREDVSRAAGLAADASAYEPAAAEGVESTSARTALPHTNIDAIAVIGLAGRYPQAPTLAEFWENLQLGKDCITEIPQERWDHERYFSPEPGQPGKTYGRWGGFIEGMDEFDPLFFGISPRDAQVIDPQERLFLQTAYHAVEDAGYSKASLQRSCEGSVGVFVGVMYGEYQLLNGSSCYGSIANRVSYYFNFNGPSLAVDTICSASSTAIHLAVQSLRRGECHLALAGGVNVSLHPAKYLTQAQLTMLSSDGRCRSFGDGGDGMVPGEGVGVVLLKDATRALVDGDHIYGLIKGTAINHGGRTNGYTVPNPTAQAQVVITALREANIDPRTISYVEAHGTGTSLGDPVEITGLAQAFGPRSTADGHCAIGSVKSNIGHLESAAGVAALTKVLLQMQHGTLVPSLHSRVLNRNITFEATPFRVQQETAPWQRPRIVVDGKEQECPRIAGISSFGAGGSNAHIVVEEFREPTASALLASVTPERPALILLSARTDERLRTIAKQLLDSIREGAYAEQDLPRIAYTLQVGREEMEYRLAFTATTLADLAQKLAAAHAAWSGGVELDACYRGDIKKHREALATLTADPEFAETLDKWLLRGKLAKLLELWVKGFSFDWTRLYSPDSIYEGSLPRRISLPVYPFARERYWVSDRPALRAAAPAAPSSEPPSARPAIELTTITTLAEPSMRSGDRGDAQGSVSQSEQVSMPSTETLEADLTCSLAEVLYMDRASVDRERPFVDMGLDSIVGVEWIRKINQVYGLSIPTVKLYDHPTIVQLALFLREQLAALAPQQSHRPLPASDAVPPDARVQTTELMLPSKPKNVALSALPATAAVFGADEPNGAAPATRPLVALSTPQIEVPARTEPARPPVSIEHLEAALAQSLAEVLYMDGVDVDRERPFVDLGLDSIVGVEWIRVINKNYGLAVPTTKLYDHSTIVKLARYLSMEIAEAQRRSAARVVPAQTTAAASAPVSAPAPTQAPAPTAAPTSTPASKSPVAEERIAIIGMSGAFPNARNLSEFWDNLAHGRDCICEIPSSRWSLAQHFDPKPGVAGKSYSKWQGLTPEMDQFDAAFFNITPVEAAGMDPQQRLFLEHSWASIEDAGIDPFTLSGTRCAVYAGCGLADYGQLDAAGALTAQGMTGTSLPVVPARIAYFLNLKGPCLAIDTACSSSLVAIAQACDSLVLERSDLAIAGGVNVVPGPAHHIMSSHAGMLSRNGRCFTFDQRADGFVPGEGVGVLLLKRLSDAVRDGNPIHGVLRGWGVNYDGKTNGMTAPSMSSQTLLEKEVYDRFGIHPETISLIETHGTATKLGDPIEVAALTDTFKSYTDRQHFCALGSVKSNVGHLLAAAGVTGVIKVLLALRHKMIPPTINYATLNEHIVLEGGPFYVSEALQEWQVGAGQLRRAAVSAFGFSGTNAHVVIEEHAAARAAVSSTQPALLLLSARNEERLSALAGRLAAHLQAEEPDLTAVAYTLQVGRAAMECRLAFVARNPNEAIASLQAYVNGERSAVLTGRASKVGSSTTAPKHDASTAAAIDVWLAERALPELAKAWINGADIDWARIYDAPPRKVALPTYAFARERHWIRPRQTPIDRPEVTSSESAVRMELTMASPDIKPSGIALASLTSLATYTHDEAHDEPPTAVRLVLETPPASVPAAQPAAQPAATPLVAPTRANDGRALQQFVDELADSLAGALFLTRSDLPVDAAFSEMGVDSIIGVEWINKINQRYAVSLSASRLYDYPSIKALAQHLLELTGASSQRERFDLEPLASEISVPVARDAIEPMTRVASDAVPHTASQPAKADRRSVVVQTFVDELVDSLAEALFLDRSELPVDAAFSELGVDSIIGVEWINRINVRYAVELSASRLYDYPSIKALASHLATLTHREPEATPVPVVLKRTEMHVAERTAIARVTSAPLQSNGTVTPLTAASTPAASKAAAPVSEPVRLRDDAIAIIGVSCAFPKARTPEEFWSNIAAGRNCIEEIPPHRWPMDQYFDTDQEAAGKSYSKWMGLLDEVDRFDPLFFSIAPTEAYGMDPQQRLFLEHSWRCVEDAGLNPRELSGARCGVYVGCTPGDYGQATPVSGLDARSLMGVATSILSARIAYFLNLKGPSISIDTACSSSLVALAQACDSLILRRTDIALAGGVCVISGPGMHVATSKAGMLSRSGRCYTFDTRADGFVPGEGVGVVLLKRLDEAVRDRDNVQAVIRGWGMNQDGKTNGITAPSVISQALLEKEVYERFGIHPESISLIEAHGTGTKLGDPIEVEALVEAFRSRTDKQEYCALGSVKTNIGHTLAAAGIAGVIKVLLALRHRMLPPTINFEALNDRVALRGSPFFINTQLRPWNAAVHPRRAAVSSFGFSGTNAHVVLEEYSATTDDSPRGGEKPSALVTLSARTPEQLKESASRLRDYLETNATVRLDELAYTLQVGREPMEHRVALVGDSRERLLAALQAYLDATPAEGVYVGQVGRVRAGASLLEGDDDVGVLMQTWMRKRKLNKLAELWVMGIGIDWTQLYGVAPRRISLPTYPFAREQYWQLGNTRGSDATLRDGSQALGAGVLHPLLHRNTSTLDEQRFSSTLHRDAFFLRDHRVAGKSVLPGVCYLEMALAAVERSLPSKEGRACVALLDVTWVQPLVVDDTRELHIAVSASGHGRIDFDIYTHDAGQETLHAQGRATAEIAADVNAPLDLAALRAACDRSIAIERCYETFGGMGLDYGPAHRGLDSVQVGADADGPVVVAHVSVPKDVGGSAHEYVLHPSILDSALQASIGLTLAANDTAGQDGRPMLPFALDRLDVSGVPPQQLWVVVRPRAARGNLQRLDIHLCNESGEVCIRLSGFAARRLDTGLDVGRTRTDEQTLLLAPHWQSRPASESGSTPVYGERWVWIDARYATQLPTLAERWPQIHFRTLAASSDASAAIVESGAMLFAEIQRLLQDKPTQSVLVQVLAVRSDVDSDAAARIDALRGLLNTARLENPQLIGQVLTLPQTADAAALSRALEEGAADPSATHVRHIHEIREAAILSQLPPIDSAVALPWKDGGVYLITGGAGGLGLIIAREIGARVAGARVILAGRSQLGADKRAQLDGIARDSRQARIDYRVLDVTDGTAVERCVAAILDEHGQLNGIVHSAGVIRDNFILKKTRAEFLSVLEPKIAGTLHLDRATRAVALDFFMTFSSIAGVFGNVGQCDYALANAYMDDFAAHRNALVAARTRQGRTLSINWPLWAEGGMHVDAATREAMSREGWNVLGTQEGIAALYAAWTSLESQVIVVTGTRAKLPGLLGAAHTAAAVIEPTPLAAAMIDISRDELHDKAIAFLKKLLAGTLKLAPDRIEAEAALEKYGIDSILALQLVNELERVFGALPKTLMFEYQSLGALTEYFLTNHRDALIGQLKLTRAAPMRTAPSVMSTPVAAPLAHSRRGRRERAADKRVSSTSVVEPKSEAIDIAIIGLSGRYPQAGDVHEFWENLKAGKDCVTEIPRERWNHDVYFDARKNVPGKSYSKWGGFIAGVDEFDPLFFNISPHEAVGMDPQERLFLQCVYQTIEDAGYTRDALNAPRESMNGNVGVFVGVMYEEYQLYGAQAQARGTPFVLGGNPSSIANRVSYFCNFHGPSMAVDTMCSSSLTAIHLACQSLRQGACELAVAGGANVSVHPNKYLLLAQGQFASSVGRCESFGKGGDGYVPGEGVGAVLLKPLAQAIVDGDHIYGVIKGTSINHGGKTNGYTVPSPLAQARVIAQALAAAQIHPRTVSCIEAHGTGTSLGDPIEIAGLTQAFGQFTQDRQFCAIGSAKSNIGHLESAAGIAALTKVLLQMQHGMLVPSLHSHELNPHIDFASTPFVVQQTLAPWPRPVLDVDGVRKEYPRIAGISSFGAGGSNAHLIIEEYVESTFGPAAATPPEHPALIVLSAKSAASLREQAARLLAQLDTRAYAERDLANVAYTLQVGREAMEHRLAFTALTIAEMRDKLGAYLERKLDSGGIDECYQGDVKKNKDALSSLTTDTEFGETIDKWIQRGKYAKLLELWVKGLPLDWSRLYGSTRPRRVSLPAYPFAKERYWPPPTESTVANAVAPVAAAAPKSLVDRQALQRLLDDVLDDKLDSRAAASMTKKLLNSEE